MPCQEQAQIRTANLSSSLQTWIPSASLIQTPMLIGANSSMTSTKSQTRLVTLNNMNSNSESKAMNNILFKETIVLTQPSILTLYYRHTFELV